MKKEIDPANRAIAEACMGACASCCTKGKLFLPPEELEEIRQHIARESPADKAAFEERLETHSGFALYDQRDRCQFLDERNLCRLHEPGVKPSECFFWPLHVYPDRETTGGLEIRVSTSCCTAHLHYTAESPLVRQFEESIASWGAERIRAFRATYAGSYAGRKLKTVGD